MLEQLGPDTAIAKPVDKIKISTSHLQPARAPQDTQRRRARRMQLLASSRCISSVRATRGISRCGGGAVAVSRIVPRLYIAIWRALSLTSSPCGRPPWRRRVYWRVWRRKPVSEAAVDITGAANRVWRLRRGVAGYVARLSPPRRAGRRPEALLFSAGN